MIIKNSFKMKILHTADWHLGKRLDNFSRFDEQSQIMEEICEIADKNDVDAVLIAGDLFDTFNPPTEAIDLFFKTLKRLSNNGNRAVIAIAGNHDSPDRIEAPDPLARECGIIFAGYPNSNVVPFELDSGLKISKSEDGFVELNLPQCDYPLRILMTPYANEFRLKTCLGIEDSEEELRSVLESKWNTLADKYCDDNGVNILLTHLFMVGKGEPLPEEPEDEKPILHVGGAQAIYTDNIPKQIQYTALGHLHRKQYTKNENSIIAYSGSPLSYSFGESNQDKYALLIDIEPRANSSVEGESNLNLQEFKINAGKRLLRKRAEGIDEALSFLNENEDALVELTMVTDTYLTAEDRKILNNAHNGIISIIPEVNNHEIEGNDFRTGIDLSKGMEDLFVDYFKHSKGQEPNQRITDLFKEILAEEAEL